MKDPMIIAIITLIRISAQMESYVLASPTEKNFGLASPTQEV